jgi:uncharacterized membrane protein YhaH (DUF805 family)
VPKIPTARQSAPIRWLLFSLKGRISRRVYWPAYLALLCLNFALYFQLVSMTEEELVGSLLLVILLVGVALLYANIGVAVKRLHDIGYGGFLAVAVPIPLIGVAFSIWVGVLPGTAGPNRFGLAPDIPQR